MKNRAPLALREGLLTPPPAPALVLLCLLTGCAGGRFIPLPFPRIPGVTAPMEIEPPLGTFPTGETLTYQVSWWGVPVGAARLTSQKASDLVRITCQAQSNKTLDAFYPVRVTLESQVDPKSRSPRRFQADVKRRWRKHESVVTFDPVKGTAFHRLPKGKNATVSVAPTTQDGLSILYYARTIPLKVGQTIPLEVTADGKNWPITAKILRMGKVELKELGSWPAVEGQVQLTFPVPFFHGARAHVWLSADKERIPLMAKIRSRVGPVTVVLTKRALMRSDA